MYRIKTAVGGKLKKSVTTVVPSLKEAARAIFDIGQQQGKLKDKAFDEFLANSTIHEGENESDKSYTYQEALDQIEADKKKKAS